MHAISSQVTNHLSHILETHCAFLISITFALSTEIITLFFTNKLPIFFITVTYVYLLHTARECVCL